MPETEHPGVYVKEIAGNRKPIDGVPTDEGDVLTNADRATWLYSIIIGGLVLVALGFGLAAIRGDILVEIIGTPGGAETLGAIVISAVVMVMLREWVERRRRKVGRPPLKFGKLEFGLAVFRLAALAAASVGLLILLVSLLAGSASPSLLDAAAINLLVGCMLASFAAGALRDLLLLLQAARSNS